MKKYYKAVRVIDGKLYSVFATGKWRKEYVPGEWTEADGISYLFVYYTDDIEDCLEYVAEKTYIVELWECEVEETHYSHDIKVDTSSYFWEGYWKAVANNMPIVWTNSVLLHTVLAKRVKLIRRVDGE